MDAIRDCPNYFAVLVDGRSDQHDTVSFRGEQRSEFRKQELQTVESEIARSIVPNQLGLNDRTARDGNCGLDALIRTLECIACETLSAVAKQLLSVLRSSNRKSAMQWLRLRLVAWIRDHRSDEMVPGMSVEDFIVSDSAARFNHESLDSYLKTEPDDRNARNSNIGEIHRRMSRQKLHRSRHSNVSPA